MSDIKDNFDEYYHTVYGFLMSLTNGDCDLSEELTQETFYRAIKNSASFKGESKVITWLCQIARYTFYQYIDKKKKRNEVPLEEQELLNEHMTMEDALVSNERKMEIYGLIQKLPDSMKEVFLYRLTGDLSFREIGNICGKTENWAKVTYYRAKQQLGKELAKEYEK